MKSTSTSQFNCISTQDTNAIRPSIHADCIGVLGFGVGAQRVAAGGPKTAGEGTPETPEIEVFLWIVMSFHIPRHCIVYLAICGGTVLLTIK